MTLRGDLDRDGQVDQSDLALLKQVLSSSGHGESLLDRLPAEEKARLDINGDGRISYDDVVKLLGMLVTDHTQTTAMADQFDALRQKARA